jgi:hypothetical protein
MIETIVAHTLIDISDGKSALQEQNLNTLIQVVSLRANPLQIETTLLGNQDLSKYDFGEDFGGNHNVWKFVFKVEQQDIFINKNGELGGLEDDVHNCPIINDLMESCNINPAVFDSKNAKTKNIYFIKET